VPDVSALLRVMRRGQGWSVTVQWIVLAHQGGWDEILLVAVPIFLFALLLRLANKRAEEQQKRVESSDCAGPQFDDDGDLGS